MPCSENPRRRCIYVRKLVVKRIWRYGIPKAATPILQEFYTAGYHDLWGCSMTMGIEKQSKPGRASPRAEHGEVHTPFMSHTMARWRSSLILWLWLRGEGFICLTPSGCIWLLRDIRAETEGRNLEARPWRGSVGVLTSDFWLHFQAPDN